VRFSCLEKDLSRGCEETYKKSSSEICPEARPYFEDQGLYICNKRGHCKNKFPYITNNFCNVELERHKKQKELSSKLNEE
jgi:hypothetical protein